jgi:galactose mutarotase-like enzyme
LKEKKISQYLTKIISCLCPFDFEVVFTYVLENGKLNIHQEYRNMGEQPMPMYAGFHPYFKTSEKHLSYETDATRYFDYNDNEEFTGRVDLGNLKEAVVLLVWDTA